MKLFYHRISVMAAIMATATALAIVSAAPAQAATNTYYIDNQAGCSNSNVGTSESAPWCDFANVNATTFGPGTQILLRRGDTWYQSMSIHGSGSSSQQNVIGAYGSGAAPVIRGTDQATDRTILMRDNPSYWTVQDLELSHAADGIRASYSTPSPGGLIFRNLYIHDLDYYVQGVPAQSPGPGDYSIYWSTSITVDGVPGFVPGTGPTASNILIDNVRTENATAPSLQAPGCNGPACPTGGLTGVIVRDSTFLDSNGGLSLQGVANATVQSNTISGMGQDAKSSGQTAVFLWGSSNVDVVDNVIESTADTHSPDQTGIDLEAYNNDIRIRGNLFRNHCGAGIEVLNIDQENRPNDFNTNILIAQNAFYKNEVDPTYGMSGSIVFNSPAGKSSGTIRDNVYYEPTTPSFIGGSDSSGWTVTNNLSGTNTGLDFSSFNFGSSNPMGNWHQQAYSGSTWTDMTSWDGNEWSSADAGTTAFELSPGSNTAFVSQMWQAPTSGTVDIRGAIQKVAAGGDGVSVLIAKNDTIVWPAPGQGYDIGANDTSVVEAAVSAIDVVAGDQIRFEVYSWPSGDSTADSVVWSPVVSYRP